MKLLLLIYILICLSIEAFAASPTRFYDAIFNGAVSVGNEIVADSTAVLDIKSTTKGLLIPRMTTTQKNAISSPTTGLIVYDTTTAALFQYNGAAWRQIANDGLNVDFNSATLTTALTVPNGGTGRQTLTNHSILLGAGTSALGSVNVGGTGRVLQGNTGADPTFSTAAYPSLANSSGSVIYANGTDFIQSVLLFPTSAAAPGVLVTNNANDVTATVCSANGNVLRRSSGAVGCGQITLNDGTNTVTGTLAVGNGGTGTTTNTSNAVLIGSGSSAITSAGPGTNNTFLRGNTGSAPTFGSVDLSTADVTGVLPNANTTATSANTNSAIVARNGSGDFSANIITAALSGNATTATTATNATNVATTSTSTNASFFPLFVASSSNGNQAASLGTGLTFNPSTNSLATTTFTGALSGNSTTATALAANPSDCASNTFAQTIAANGNLTCATPDLSTADVTGTLAIGKGGTGQTTKATAFDALSPMTTKGDIITFSTLGVRLGVGSDGQVLSADSSTATGLKWVAAGTGSVTSVALTAPAIFNVTGSPITTSGTLALAATGTSGGIPYFDSSTSLASSAALTANRLVLGGGAGAAPTVLGSLGTTTQVLHGNAGGAPTFGAVSLTADVSGVTPLANGGTSNGSLDVTTGKLLYGDGSKVNSAAGTNNYIVQWSTSGAPGSIAYSADASWSATATNNSNTSSLSAAGDYVRIGARVVFWFQVAFTASNANTDFDVSLPVASTFSSSSDVSGNCASNNAGYARILADTGGVNKLRIQSGNSSVAAITYFCTGGYWVH